MRLSVYSPTTTTATTIMIIFYSLILLIPAILASPVYQRQNISSPSNTTAPPKVTIGGLDHPVEITGTVNTATNLDQYFNIPFAKPRMSPDNKWWLTSSYRRATIRTSPTCDIWLQYQRHSLRSSLSPGYPRLRFGLW